MKIRKIHLVIVLCILGFSNCSKNIKASKIRITSSNKILYSENFKLIKHPFYLELQIIDPVKGIVERRYALVDKGKSPVLSSNMERIDLPVKGMICLSATHIGMLHKLNEISSIKGVSNRKYVDNANVLTNIKANKIQEFSGIDQLNPERILKTNAKVVIYDGFGTFPANEDKLKKLGIVCIPDYDWRETNPLGKAEWIKLFGILSGKEKMANDYFTSIEKEYQQLKREEKKINSHHTFISGSLIGDLWYMPAGQSFLAKLLKDAQVNYVENKSKGTGSVSFSLEHCLKAHKEAQIWINPGVVSYKELLELNPKYRFFQAFKTKNIYCYSHNANYFWENSAIEPQHVLSDYIQLNRGELSNKKLYFYQKLKE
jgi:iron complex transport system substrate-binding protein